MKYKTVPVYANPIREDDNMAGTTANPTPKTRKPLTAKQKKELVERLQKGKEKAARARKRAERQAGGGGSSPSSRSGRSTRSNPTGSSSSPSTRANPTKGKAARAKDIFAQTIWGIGGFLLGKAAGSLAAGLASSFMGKSPTIQGIAQVVGAGGTAAAIHFLGKSKEMEWMAFGAAVAAGVNAVGMGIQMLTAGDPSNRFGQSLNALFGGSLMQGGIAQANRNGKNSAFASLIARGPSVDSVAGLLDRMEAREASQGLIPRDQAPAGDAYQQAAQEALANFYRSQAGTTAAAALPAGAMPAGADLPASARASMAARQAAHMAARGLIPRGDERLAAAGLFPGRDEKLAAQGIMPREKGLEAAAGGSRRRSRRRM